MRSLRSPRKPDARRPSRPPFPETSSSTKENAKSCSPDSPSVRVPCPLHGGSSSICNESQTERDEIKTNLTRWIRLVRCSIALRLFNQLCDSQVDQSSKRKAIVDNLSLPLEVLFLTSCAGMTCHVENFLFCPKLQYFLSIFKYNPRQNK